MFINPSFCYDAFMGVSTCNLLWSGIEITGLIIIAWWGVNVATKKVK